MIQEILTELVRKECETYRLMDWGLLTSVDEGVTLLLSAYPSVDPSILADWDRFRDWRSEVLHHFYERLDYAGFLAHTIETDAFRRFLFVLKRRIVSSLHQQCQEPTIDKDLAIASATFAFKLSALLDEELFYETLPVLRSVETPIQLEHHCRNRCQQLFPIDIDHLMMQLRKDDSEFWNDLYLTVKRIAHLVTFGQSVSIQYRKEIVQDVWTDSSLLLHEKVLQMSAPEFESSLHFRNYIARICLNKCREAIRKHQLPDISLTVTGEMPPDFWDEDEKPQNMEGIDSYLVTMDLDNKDEVEHLFAMILWDKLEPWYSDMTHGIEDKIELIFLHYVEGLSYEQIALHREMNVSGEALNRLIAKLRQDAVRTRQALKQRFYRIIEKKLGVKDGYM